MCRKTACVLAIACLVSALGTGVQPLDLGGDIDRVAGALCADTWKKFSLL